MKGEFVTDIERIWDEFQQLTKVEMSKAVKRALNKAANILKNQTKANLESMIKNHGTTMPKYNDYLKEGVIMHSAKGAYDSDLTSVVHIMGKQSSGTSTFILRMLEGGTKERYAVKYRGKPLQKPRYLGQIKPMYFFKSANQSIEPQLEHIYLEEIDKTIEKINHQK